MSNPYSEKYKNLWNTMVLNVEPVDEANKIIQNKHLYMEIESRTGVPWYVVGVIHGMESSFRTDRHLHNGDPLTHRTVLVPRGRPIKGTPPFTFVESAVDALDMKKSTFPNDWKLIDDVLYFLERYNGLGYANKGINSPYLWCGSNHYTSGKYVSDGKFDPTFKSKQTGCAVVLKYLEIIGHINLKNTIIIKKLNSEEIENGIDKFDSTPINKLFDLFAGFFKSLTKK